MEGDRWELMPRHTILQIASALRARVVTPTSGVRIQCTSRVLFSPVRGSGAAVHRSLHRPPLRGHERNDERMPPRLARVVAASLIGVLVFFGAVPPAIASPADLRSGGWIWPVEVFRLSKPFVAPAHAYGPGHRGIDLEPAGSPAVRAPAPGVVAFSGPVAGRAIVTIDHGNGLVTTLEPVASDLRPGDAVARGDPMGTITVGGHATPGSVHFGVRLDGEYINPLLLLGGVPRAVLLPCCR